MRLRSAHVEYMNYLAPVHIEVKARMMRRQQTGNAYSSCAAVHVCIRGHSLPAVWDFHQHHLLRGIFINHIKSDSNTPTNMCAGLYAFQTFTGFLYTFLYRSAYRPALNASPET